MSSNLKIKFHCSNTTQKSSDCIGESLCWKLGIGENLVTAIPQNNYWKNAGVEENVFPMIFHLKSIEIILNFTVLEGFFFFVFALFSLFSLYFVLYFSFTLDAVL